ncbi:dipeptidase [Pontibacter akesuensis]|uniref:Membrane dipeptidase n=1 Tax=Pontibacter akesuensis TaxID=388950 RepID=A0A1I7G1T8_9BACT|nr:dipeptidase [Pontibacter akesuensis]GHA59289.1 dipeptidase [Pontibacter akesuensis]SFU42420.1 membrane dipeptidase [Pontibacter akesuensis]
MNNRFILVGLGATLGLSLASLSSQAQDYKKIHAEAIVADTHNDVLINVMEGLNLNDDLRGKTHSDLARFKEGGVDVQVFSVWSDETGSFKYAMQQIDSLEAIVKRNPDKMVLVTNYKEVMQAVKQGKMAAMIGVEGGHMIENDLKKLEQMRKRGAIYLTLTWNNSTPWATSAMAETSGKLNEADKGLSDLGKQIVRRMNKLGMLVDLSHVGEKTFWDVMAITKKPVLVSHSDVYALNPVFRNLKDEQIKAVAKNGGVIQLNFFSDFLDPNFRKRINDFQRAHKSESDSLETTGWTKEKVMDYMAEAYPAEVEQIRPPLSVLIDHIDYIVKLVGVDYVGLGSDFDGITSAPQQLDGVDTFPLITKELVARGYSESDIKKILGGNFLRVLKANAS